MTNTIDQKKILEAKCIEQLAINKKKQMLLQSLDFSDRHASKSEFISRLSSEDYELLKIAVKERMNRS